MKDSNPPFKREGFDVPDEVGAYYLYRLKQTKLVEFYSLNRQDLIDLVGLFYFIVITDPDHGRFTNPQKGFASFCDLLTEIVLAAPSQRNMRSVSSTGLRVNFIAEPILAHLEVQSKLRIQDFYASSGAEKHPIVWVMVADFVRYIAIEAFKSGIGKWGEDQRAAARARWMELQKGDRTMKTLHAPRGFY